MNFEQYRPLALRTAKMFPTQRENLRHAALGLTTEIGEFATEVKRIVIYGKPLTDEMRAHMREELGDAYWYLPLAFMSIGADPFDPRKELGFNSQDIADTTLGLACFSGSIGAFILDGSVEDDRLSLIGMLSALLYLLDQTCAALGFDPDEVRAENIAKLRKRFPDAYSDQAAEARADKGGLPASVS